jgi:hypothetical protein|tara:strand:- start:4626 stop:5534 length:909 start_codon:yes stop_codon:yes gene_type:complete
MAVITSGNFPQALRPGINAIWGAAYAKHEPEYPMLFEMNTSTRNYEEDVLQTGFGLAPVKAEGASVSYDSESQGYTSRHTHVNYGLGFIITEEAIEDNEYMKMAETRTPALAFSMQQTHENVGANVFNNGFDSDFTGGDGVELFSTSHPTINGNQSNHLTTAADLSEASLEDLSVQIMRATNERGHNIRIMPQCLAVPPQLFYEAHRIYDSTLQNDSANNAVNVLKAQSVLPEGIKINHYFTDVDAWFILTNAPRGMVHYQRRDVKISSDNDFDTTNAKYKATERYSAGWVDWRGAYGSPGA